MGILRITVVVASFALAASAFAPDPVAKPARESSTVLATWSIIEKDSFLPPKLCRKKNTPSLPQGENSKVRARLRNR